MARTLGAATWLLTLAGCSASVAPIEVAAGCPDRPVRAPTQYADEPQLRLIDDFEHEGNFIPKVDGRTGFWVVGTDDTDGTVEAKGAEDCAARGKRSGHFVGSGFTSWGVNWTALLRDSRAGSALPYDATRYGGVSFWAAAGGSVAAPYALPVGVTTMDVAWNGNICDRCMDYYRTEILLERTWQRFELRFAELKQSGTGSPLVELRSDALVGVIFWPQRDFDVWVDDVRFEP